TVYIKGYNITTLSNTWRLIMESRINDIVNKLSENYQKYGSTIKFEKDETLERYQDYFIEKFSLATLERMSPQETLNELMNMNNQESMIYWLEFKNDEEFKTGLLGGIQGGSAGKYTMFHSKKYNQ